MKMKQAIVILNNEAVSFCNSLEQNCRKSIQYLEQALILCKDLERSRPVRCISASTRAKIESSISDSISNRVKNESVSSMISDCTFNKYPDEGLRIYTRTLSVPENREDADSLNELPLPALEAILTFNLGVCYLILDDKGCHEADLYFDRTRTLLSHELITDDEVLLSDDAPFHLSPVAILHNQGLRHSRAGRHNDAMNCYTSALDISVLKYGPQHISVAVALNSIGVVASTGPRKEACDNALQYFTKSLSIRLHALNEVAASDKNTAVVLNHIGRIKFHQNDFMAALSFHEEAHKIQRILLGDKHIDTGATAFNVGHCHYSLGNIELATQFYALFVKSIFSSALEYLTDRSVLALEYIACRFHEDGSFEHAIAYYELALKSAQKVFGRYQPIVAQILNKSGNLLFESGNLDGALKIYEQGLDIEKKVYPSNHRNISTTLSNIARIHEQNGDLEESLRCYEQSVDTLRGTKGENETIEGIASTLWSMGSLHEKMGNASLALKAFNETLSIQRKEVGDYDFLVSCTLNRIGIIRMGKGQLQEALENFKECFKIRQFLSSPSRSLATVLFNIASVHYQNGNAETALETYQELFNLEKWNRENCKEDFDALGALETLHQIATIFREQFINPVKALSCYKEAINIFSEEKPEVVPLEIRSKYFGMAANLALELGDSENAMRILSQTVRTNRSAGLHDYANVNIIGYDLFMFLKKHRPSAPAA